METNQKAQEEIEEISDDFVTQTAYKNFGIKYLYPWQRLVVANILEAYEYHKNIADYEDIGEADDSFCKGRQIVLLPTGAGKSLVALLSDSGPASGRTFSDNLPAFSFDERPAASNGRGEPEKRYISGRPDGCRT